MNTNKEDMIKYNNNHMKALVLDYRTKHKGETQVTVAKKIGVSVTTLFYENPTVETLCKAANFFQCDLNIFFDIPEEILSERSALVSMPNPEYKILRKDEKESIERQLSALREDLDRVLKKLDL